MSEKHTCDQNVNKSRWSRLHKPCGKTANSQHEGKWYCGIHDPMKRAERSKIRDDQMRKRWEAENIRRDHQQRLTAAREAVVEAAKRWWEEEKGAIRTPEEATLAAAVARLLEVEKENG